MRCATCSLAEGIRAGEVLDLSFTDPCANCGAIRGGHSPDHPHTRFGHCPGFAKLAPPIEQIVADLQNIEERLRKRE